MIPQFLKDRGLKERMTREWRDSYDKIINKDNKDKKERKKKKIITVLYN